MPKTSYPLTNLIHFLCPSASADHHSALCFFFDYFHHFVYKWHHLLWYPWGASMFTQMITFPSLQDWKMFDFMYIYTLHVLYPFISKSCPCFLILVTVNNVDVNTEADISLPVTDFISSGYITRSGVAESYGSYKPNFWVIPTNSVNIWFSKTKSISQSQQDSWHPSCKIVMPSVLCILQAWDGISDKWHVWKINKKVHRLGR